MSPLVCPKCGSVQEGGEECRRCGVIFRKVREIPAIRAVGSPRLPGPLLRKSWRVLRWVPLAVSLSVLGLLLLKPSPPRVQASEEATGEAILKVADFERSVNAGTPAVLEMDEPQLNGWVRSNIVAPGKPQPSDIARAYVSGQPPPRDEEVRSNVRDVRLKLEGERLLAWVSYEAYGLEVALELEGTLSVQDGYLRLTPTSGRLGSIPLTRSVLDAASRRLFDSPENKEKFRLPPHIADIRVADSKLAVVSR